MLNVSLAIKLAQINFLFTLVVVKCILIVLLTPWFGSRVTGPLPLSISEPSVERTDTHLILKEQILDLL